MKPPRIVKFRDFKKMLRRYGVKLRPGGKHMLFESRDGVKYPVPFHRDGDDVVRDYVNGARRAFGLTKEDGVSDEEFYNP